MTPGLKRSRAWRAVASSSGRASSEARIHATAAWRDIMLPERSISCAVISSGGALCTWVLPQASNCFNEIISEIRERAENEGMSCRPKCLLTYGPQIRLQDAPWRQKPAHQPLTL